MKYAILHCSAKPDYTDHFMILRAAHYLSEFMNIPELRLDLPEPEPSVRETWTRSLTMRKREIRIVCGAETPERLPLFAAPDYPVTVMDETGMRRPFPLNPPDIPGLTDFHVHTHLAYCSENMDVEKAVRMERLSGVKAVNFSEHSGQLYCPPEIYWQNRFVWKNRVKEDDRTARYEELAARHTAEGVLFGSELDVDAHYDVADLRMPPLTGYRLGAVHFVDPTRPFEEVKRDFMNRVKALADSGIDILAHPFRIFIRKNLPVPEDLFEPLSDLLAERHIAAEINYHTMIQQPDFVISLLKKGGKISFGSDSHNLYEAGYLLPHYQFAKSIGIAGKLDRYLLSAGR